MIARFVWHGIEGMRTYTSGSDWKGLIRQMSTVFPEAWEKEAKKRLGGYNIRFIESGQEIPRMTGFPDGAMWTLVFPLPATRLPDLIDLLDALDGDPAIAATVNLFVIMTEAGVDYVRGRCPDVPDDLEALARHSRKFVGLPCHGIPQYQTLNDGRCLLALRRRIYLVHVGCSFRDLERIVAHCGEDEYIGAVSRARTPSEYPHGIEWSALAMPGGSEMQIPELKFSDEGPTRRLVYGTLLKPKHLLRLADSQGVSREEALERLVLAREWARRQLYYYIPND